MSKKLNQKSYNEIVNEWHEARKNGSISSLLKSFTSKLKLGDHVLDIGCGTGYPITKFLSDQELIITGIDFAENMIKKAKTLNIKNANFITIDFFDFEPKIQFDGIVAFDSLFHFEKNKQKDIYLKVSNILKTKGYFLFTHGKHNHELTNEMFGEKFYYSSLTIDEVKKLLKIANFEIVQLVEDYQENQDTRELIVLAQKR